METIQIGKFSFRVDESGIYLDNAADDTNLADLDFVEGLTVARKLYAEFTGDDLRRGYVYIASGNPYPTGKPRGYFKIGSSYSMDGRRSYGVRVLVHVIACDTRRDAFQLEAHFHRIFASCLAGAEKEWFDLRAAQLDYVKSFQHRTREQIAEMRKTETRFTPADIESIKESEATE